jgi:hypothetical protein
MRSQHRRGLFGHGHELLGRGGLTAMPVVVPFGEMIGARRQPPEVNRRVAIGGCAAIWLRLLDWNRIGCWKGILKGFVERLFLPHALTFFAIAIILVRFVLRLNNHRDLYQVQRA